MLDGEKDETCESPAVGETAKVITSLVHEQILKHRLNSENKLCTQKRIMDVAQTPVYLRNKPKPKQGS